MTNTSDRGRLCLLSFHAHPDDESSKGAGTVHRYAQEGVHCVLVCATGGEMGEILNPAMDSPEVRDNLAEVRRAELAKAAEIIGFDRVVMLGYRDSGMADSPANDEPTCFAQADEGEAVGRLVEVIRQERPHVVLTYADDQEGYPHPDHLRVHDVGIAAFDAAGDPSAYPEAGPPWRPSKLYYSAWSRARLRALHEKFLELGIESPFDQKWLERPGHDERITTRVHVPDGEEVRRAALLAHATQIDPASPFWFGLPSDVAAYPYEDFILARSDVDSPPPEDDLFAGLRG
ncbi:MAG: mycothiol conjugate amidase Mca [Acidimicrobiales bacterium]